MATTDIGRAVPLLRGEYDPAQTYELNDIVSLNGSLYWHFSHEVTTNVAPQATSTWKIVLSLTDAEAYIARAESAAEEAESAKDDAVTAKTAAETASATATGASEAATAAKDDAVTARNAAQTAETGAVEAKNAAVSAKEAAQSAASSAGTSATSAGNSAGTAEYYATNAETAAETATTKASEASASATTASSAATTATEAKNTAVSSASTATTKAGEASTSATSAASSAAAAQAVKDSIPEDYSALSEDVSELKTQITQLDTKKATKKSVDELYDTIDAVVSPNLFDMNCVTSGELNDSGEVIAAQNRLTTDFIPISAGQVLHYQFAYNGNRYDNTTVQGYTYMTRGCAYDENKQYIPNSYQTNFTSYTAPENTAYVRVTLSTNASFTDKALIIANTATVIPYSPYGEILASIIDDIPRLKGNYGDLAEKYEKLDVYDLKMVRDYLGFTKEDANDINYSYTGGTWKYKDTVLDANYSGKVTVVIGQYDNTSAGDFIFYNAAFSSSYTPQGLESEHLTEAGAYTFTASSGFAIRLQAARGTETSSKDCYIKGIVIYYGGVDFSAQGLPDSFTGLSKATAPLNGDKIIQSKNTGVSVTIDVPQFKKNIVIGYLGFFDSWTDLYIYQGKNNGFTGRLLKITSDSIELWRMDKYNATGDTHVREYGASHGITTMADYVSVLIQETENGACKVYLCSNGQTYTSPEWNWGSSRKDILVEHGSASWTNILSWGSTDFIERTWLYGDSYFDHWLKKVIERGNTAFVDDGYSGASSANGLASFQLAITKGCPHTVVWCLGMNDPDNGAINSSWKTAIDTVKSICDAKGIDLIVTTIPNVPGTDGNYWVHTYKNAYIKSNFNYIDIAEYVGASTSEGSETTWYTGLLSSDGIHPSAIGDFYIANVMQTFLPDLRNS